MIQSSRTKGGGTLLQKETPPHSEAAKSTSMERDGTMAFHCHGWKTEKVPSAFMQLGILNLTSRTPFMFGLAELKTQAFINLSLYATQA